MEAVRNLSTQLAELYRTMSPRARWVVALLGALAIVGMGYVAWRDQTREHVVLLGGQEFSDQELKEVRAAFTSAGLNDYRIQGHQVRVPRQESTRYLTALAPLAQRQVLPYEVFKKAMEERSLLTPQGDLDRQWELAAQQYLAAVIRNMEGIEDAWVLWDRSPKSGLIRRQDVRASVMVKPLAAQPLSLLSVASIRELLVGSVAGLSPADLTIVDTSGRAYRGDDPALDASKLRAIQYWDRHYRQRIEQLLSHIDGVRVNVSVELERAADSATSGPDEESPRSPKTQTRDSRTDGVPDKAVAQSRQAAASKPDVEETSRRDEVAQRGVPKDASDDGHRSEWRAHSLFVSIGIPEEYCRKEFAGVDGSSWEDFLKSQGQGVEQLVRSVVGEDGSSQIIVHSYRRSEPALAVGDPSREVLIAIPHKWAVIGAVAAAVVGLFVIALWWRRRLGRSAGRRMTATSRVEPSGVKSAPHFALGGSESGRQAETSLRGNLQQLAQKEPGRVAQLLERWLQQGQSG